MNTKTLNFVLLMLCYALLFSCSGEDSNSRFSEETYFETYLSTTGFDQKIIEFVENRYFEMGTEFTPLVNGNITSLQVRIPNEEDALRVTIWDKNTETAIRTELASVSAGTEHDIDIIDLGLEGGKTYAITMNTITHYYRQRADLEEVTYPIYIGNIRIDKCIQNAGREQDYPQLEETFSYSGDLSFTFLRTEKEE